MPPKKRREMANCLEASTFDSSYFWFWDYVESLDIILFLCILLIAMRFEIVALLNRMDPILEFHFKIDKIVKNRNETKNGLGKTQFYIQDGERNLIEIRQLDEIPEIKNQLKPTKYIIRLEPIKEENEFNATQIPDLSQLMTITEEEGEEKKEEDEEEKKEEKEKEKEEKEKEEKEKEEKEKEKKEKEKEEEEEKEKE